MTRDVAQSSVSAARDALKQGKLETAAQIAADLLRAAPDNLDALEIKALVEIERDDHAAAEQSLRSAIALAPDRRWPYADLYRLLLKLGRSNEAESVARDAVRADPANADAHAMLGSLLAQREMLVPAGVHFEKAIALAGRHPDLLLGLGAVLLRQGRLEEARPLLEAAAAAQAGALRPAVLLAQLEERSGDFDAALRWLDRAEPVAASLGTGVTLQRSIVLERRGDVGAALELIETEQEPSGAALLQRGRLRDALGRYPEAWDDWVAGKAMLAAKFNREYPAGEVEWQARALATFFDSARVAELPRAPVRDDVPQPIFVLGFPRSGTTLVEQVLASHSAIRAGGELPFGRDLREHAVALVGGEAAFPDGLDAHRAEWPESFRDFYLTRAAAYGLTTPGAHYFTDKMPLNDMWLPLLRSAFPQSPVVLVRRHPLDVLTSAMAHDMTHGFNCTYRLGDAATHLALIDWLLDHYRTSDIEVTYELRYESFVADQLGETRRLMEAIGLEVEPAQLRFHERVTVVPTPSYAQVRQPLNDRSVGRWRNYSAQLDAIRPVVLAAMVRGDYVD